MSIKFHVHITVAYSVKALDFGLMGHGWKSYSGFTCCHINAVLGQMLKNSIYGNFKTLL